MQCVYFVCVVIFRKIERAETVGGGCLESSPHTHTWKVVAARGWYT